jgi:ubiquinol oxidase
MVVRADEAHHRDVNHAFAYELAGLAESTIIPAAWPHQPLELHWRGSLN